MAFPSTPKPSLLERALSVLKPKTRGETPLPGTLARTGYASRGLRNNNPGNLRHSPSRWIGQLETQTDPAFVQFDTMAHGVRAMAVDLRTHASRGASTIRQLVTIWAPPSENNTTAYVQAVCTACGVRPDDPYPIATVIPLRALCVAITEHENGVAVASDPDLARALTQGVRMALGVIPS